MKFNTVLFVNATIGFSENLFLVCVIIIIQELCNTTTLEAECSKGEGLEFDFVEPSCVPGYTGWGIGKLSLSRIIKPTMFYFSSYNSLSYNSLSIFLRNLVVLLNYLTNQPISTTKEHVVHFNL